jgi:hypothetical protein
MLLLGLIEGQIVGNKFHPPLKVPNIRWDVKKIIFPAKTS